jgi:acetyl esterase/lipase
MRSKSSGRHSGTPRAAATTVIEDECAMNRPVRIGSGGWISAKNAGTTTSQVYPWRQARLPGRSAIRRPCDDDNCVRRDWSPALVNAAEADVLCDQGVAFGRKLRQAGVDVAALRYAGSFTASW